MRIIILILISLISGCSLFQAVGLLNNRKYSYTKEKITETPTGLQNNKLLGNKLVVPTITSQDKKKKLGKDVITRPKASFIKPDDNLTFKESLKEANEKVILGFNSNNELTIQIKTDKMIGEVEAIFINVLNSLNLTYTKNKFEYKIIFNQLEYTIYLKQNNNFKYINQKKQKNGGDHSDLLQQIFNLIKDEF